MPHHMLRILFVCFYIYAFYFYLLRITVLRCALLRFPYVDSAL